MNTVAQSPINVGVDVSQSQLDIYIRPLDIFRSFPNSDNGIAKAVRFVKQHQPARVIVESTGRLEVAFFCAAHKAKLPVSV